MAAERFNLKNLAETLAEVVSSRQAVLVEHSAKEEAPSPSENKRGTISRKIREFFNLKTRA